MKTISKACMALLVALNLSSHHAAEGDPLRARIIKHLQDHIEMFVPGSLRNAMTADEVWAESERDWRDVQANFLAMLRRNGWEDRRDLVESKESVHKAWQRSCRVLLEIAAEPESKLYKYDEGPNGSVGYVIFQGGTPRYWLHSHFNRTRDKY